MIFEQLNPGACRTYLIACEQSRQAAIVDPVLDRVDDYVRLLEKERWKLAYIVDTHTHADHISAGPALSDAPGERRRYAPVRYCFPENAVYPRAYERQSGAPASGPDPYR